MRIWFPIQLGMHMWTPASIYSVPIAGLVLSFNPLLNKALRKPALKQWLDIKGFFPKHSLAGKVRLVSHHCQFGLLFHLPNLVNIHNLEIKGLLYLQYLLFYFCQNTTVLKTQKNTDFQRWGVRDRHGSCRWTSLITHCNHHLLLTA